MPEPWMGGLARYEVWREKGQVGKGPGERAKRHPVRQPIVQGLVDSVIGHALSLPGISNRVTCYWFTAGDSWQLVPRPLTLVRHNKAMELIKRTSDYWNLWACKAPLKRGLPKKTEELCRHGLLLLQTQIYSAGGILAANASDVIQFNHDNYGFYSGRLEDLAKKMYLA